MAAVRSDRLKIVGLVTFPLRNTAHTGLLVPSGPAQVAGLKEEFA